tara:strand:+ start:323 stop:562 length:240 start_codon:yes stop_codon:yes gene_type:complete
MTKQERIEHISNALNESGAYKKLEYFLVYEDETNDFLLTDMENFAYDLEEFIEGWASNKENADSEDDACDMLYGVDNNQ